MCCYLNELIIGHCKTWVLYLCYSLAICDAVSSSFPDYHCGF